jgi:beta-galactosidase
MEQQPGPVNWAQANPDPLPGMARLWAWEAFAHGAEVVSYFRWRQAPFAQEQMHAGLLRPDSQPAPAYHEASQVARRASSDVGIGGAATRGRVALVYDYQSEWAWEIQPQAARASGMEIMSGGLYSAFRKHGLDVDILSPSTSSFDGYDIVAIPALFAWTDALRDRRGQFRGTSADRTAVGFQDRRTSPFPHALVPICRRTCSTPRCMRVDSADPPASTVAVKGGGAVRPLWRETARDPRPSGHGGCRGISRSWCQPGQALLPRRQR